MEYTYADVIINPEDPRVEIGKEYYFGDTPAEALKFANDNGRGAILADADDEDNQGPFWFKDIGFTLSKGRPCIIRKKEDRPAKFKIGDKVRIVKEWDGHEYYSLPTVGKTGEIKEIGEFGSYRVCIPSDDDWWWYKSDALELIEETAEEKKSYEERQAEWIEANGIKIGDKVRVLRKAESHEDGWDNVWADSMSQSIGETLVVDSINGDRGIALDGPALEWKCNFPYFVLEKVEDQPRYTEADIISDPCDPRLAGAIGKRVFYCDGGVSVLADAESNKRTGILDGINNSPWPFTVGSNSWACIIIAKDQPDSISSSNEDADQPEYVPFDLDNPEVRRELMGKTIINNYGLDGDGEFREVMIVGFMNKSDEDRDCWSSNGDTEGTIAMTVEGYFHADELLKECTFLNGTPCGKLKED